MRGSQWRLQLTCAVLGLPVGPSQMHMLQSNRQGDGSGDPGRRWGGEGGALMRGLSEEAREPACSLCAMRCFRKWAVSPELGTCRYPGLGRSTFLLSTSYSGVIIVAAAKLTKTVYLSGQRHPGRGRKKKGSWGHVAPGDQSTGVGGIRRAWP